jgi:hypothetical protein
LKPSPLEALFLLIALAFLVASSTACGRPFRVSEQVRPVGKNHNAHTTVDGLAVEAAALTDEDELMRLFNANMILARILVVRLTLKNQSDNPVDIHRLSLDLRDARNHEFDSLQPSDAVDKLYDYYEIRTYRIRAREEVEANFERAALQTDNELKPGEARQGLIFFEIPKEVDNLTPLGELALRLKRLRWSPSGQDKTIELQLNPRWEAVSFQPSAISGTGNGFFVATQIQRIGLMKKDSRAKAER